MISVVVPVYNVEKYLTRCINSILRQSFADFELLLVDDGSTDKSGSICEQYTVKDSRIRVFHKKNGGLSDARNFGLDQMHGEFVSFIDSDDYVGPDYLRILVEMQEQFQADLTMLVTASTHSEGTEFVDSADKRWFMQPKEALRSIASGEYTGVSACGKLFRRSIFAQKRFPVGMLYEDMHTIPYLIEDCHACALSTSIQYYYFQRSDSITHNISDKAIEMWNGGIEKLYDYVEQRDPEAVDCVICRYVLFGFGVVVNNLIDSDSYVLRSRQFRDRHHDWWKAAAQNKYLKKKDKVKVGLFLTDVRLYRIFYKLYQVKKKHG